MAKFHVDGNWAMLAGRGMLLAAALAIVTGAAKKPAAPKKPAAATKPVVDFSTFDKIPAGIFDEMTDRTKSVGYVGLAWKVNTVNVAFSGGDPGLYALIEQTASEWTNNGGRLKFSFRTSDGAFRMWKNTNVTPKNDIRIGFFTDEKRGGYWSVIGSLARRINLGEPTMNFGDLGTTLSRFYNGANRAEWLNSYSHSVILHEFGHSLGLSHEHFYPTCQSDLNLQAIVQYLMGPPNNWQYDKAMFNMDAKTYFDQMSLETPEKPTFSPTIDQASVMLYSFPDSFYGSGIKSPCRPSGVHHFATVLSSDDRVFYMKSYGGN